MKIRFAQRVAVSLAAVGLCVPQLAMASAPQPTPSPSIADLQLADGDLLVGQVVTPENAPVAGVDVALRSGTQELAVAKTDASGFFAFRGLKNGIYQVVTPEGQATYRVWTKGTAPPAAQSGALIVHGDGMIRGQHQLRHVRNLLANPWVVAGIIALAVAIPVAIHNSQKGPSSP